MISPVLFLVFNRPHLTRRVFERIALAKPPRLYVAADGPRNGNLQDQDLCRQVREIVRNIDWPCTLKMRFHQNNHGVKYAISGAIDWFFENEELGIILEDDTLPSYSFFNFCDEILERFKDDARISHINGYNALSFNMESSYRFTRLPNIWGWASWRRSWQAYRINPTILDIDSINFEVYGDQAQSVKNVFTQHVQNNFNTWDIQWLICMLKNNFISITPNKSLIKNIGFGDCSTNTKAMHRVHSMVESSEIPLPLAHPKKCIVESELDRDYLIHIGRSGTVMERFRFLLVKLGLRFNYKFRK
jgi:hypothetical protein